MALTLRTHYETEERARDRLIVAAWLTANYSRAKRMPSLKEVLSRKPAKMTEAEMAKLRAQHAEMVEGLSDGR